ncbi:MAG: hypothetical protein ACR2GX_07880 [Candidatus Dormibacteria bacterium]
MPSPVILHLTGGGSAHRAESLGTLRAMSPGARVMEVAATAQGLLGALPVAGFLVGKGDTLHIVGSIPNDRISPPQRDALDRALGEISERGGSIALEGDTRGYPGSSARFGWEAAVMEL